MNTGQIIKSKSTDRFTVISNEISQSTDLSLEEKGLLVFLLSLPNDWILYKKLLPEKLNTGKSTIDRVWKGLQEKGYIHSIRCIDGGGMFIGWNHVVYDIPTVPEKTDNLNIESPKSGNTDIGESSPILSINLSTNTKEDTKKQPFLEFLKHINTILQKKRGFMFNDGIYKKFCKRLKEGFTLDDFKKAVNNASKDKYHRETAFKYLTPEFFSRPDKLDMWLNAGDGTLPENKKQTDIAANF